jgi:hypothetical protein
MTFAREPIFELSVATRWEDVTRAGLQRGEVASSCGQLARNQSLLRRRRLVHPRTHIRSVFR